MMCDVMPTISEDGSNDRESQGSGDESNFEQLMVNMLDERDKLMETLRETQEALAGTQAKLQEVEKDRNNLQKQMSATTPQVSVTVSDRVVHVLGYRECGQSIKNSTGGRHFVYIMKLPAEFGVLPVRRLTH